jgi:hypothetical protein
VTRPRLSDIEPMMHSQCMDANSHDIYYTPVGGSRRTLCVQGNYEDGVVTAGFSAAVEQKIELMVMKTDVPARPSKGVRITLPRVPGKMYEPVDVQDDATGYHWLFNLKAVTA